MSILGNGWRDLGTVAGAVLLSWSGLANAMGPVCHGGLYQRWKFHAGAPLAAPAVIGAEGQVAVGSHEGYLHSLSWEGAFLWSYTVDGGLLDGVAVGSGQRFMAVSTAGKIYSLAPDGTPHWVFSTGFVPGYGAADAERGIYFVTRGDGLFAVSSRAGFLWSIDLGSAPQTRLRVDAEGYVWFVTGDQRLHRMRTPYFHRSWPLPQSPSSARLVAASTRGALLLAGDELSFVDVEGQTRWQRPEVRAAALTLDGGPPLAVVVGEQDLIWLDGSSGAEIARVALQAPEPSEARSSLDSKQRLPSTTTMLGRASQQAASLELAASAERAMLGTVDGQLLAFDRTGRRGGCRISTARLFAPQIDRAHDQVVVSAGNGDIVAVAFEGWK